MTCDVAIPDNAIPDASKLFVKVYPGVMSQVLEGVDGLIRLPVAEWSRRRRRPTRTFWWSIRQEGPCGSPELLAKSEHLT